MISRDEARRTLGVSPTDPDSVVRAAYRKIAIGCHPPSGQHAVWSAAARERFKQVSTHLRSWFAVCKIFAEPNTIGKIAKTTSETSFFLLGRLDWRISGFVRSAERSIRVTATTATTTAKAKYLTSSMQSCKARSKGTMSISQPESFRNEMLLRRRVTAFEARTKTTIRPPRRTTMRASLNTWTSTRSTHSI